MMKRRAFVHVAFGVCFLSFLIIIGIDAARAGTRCPAQGDSVALKQKHVAAQTDSVIPLDDAASPYRTWKSVEYLNRPIAGYLCDGANKVQIICFRQ